MYNLFKNSYFAKPYMYPITKPRNKQELTKVKKSKIIRFRKNLSDIFNVFV